MALEDILSLPVEGLALSRSHLYLWMPNALLAEGLAVMKAWGFTYKTHLIWYKVRKDGGPDSRSVGLYFRNMTKGLLFRTRGGLAYPCAWSPLGERHSHAKTGTFPQT